MQQKIECFEEIHVIFFPFVWIKLPVDKFQILRGKF